MDRIRHRADFLAAAKAGPTTARAPAPAFTVQRRLRHDDGPIRFGFTVSKKVGNAPERNRVKRRLRALVRNLAPETAQASADYVVIGKREALSRDFATLTDDFSKALARLGRIPSSPPQAAPKAHSGTTDELGRTS